MCLDRTLTPAVLQGLEPALLKGPCSRFGDIAANAGVLGLLDQSTTTIHELPDWIGLTARCVLTTKW